MRAVASQRAEHHELALREVDDANRGKDQREAKRHQSVNASYRQAGHDELEQKIGCQPTSASDAVQASHGMVHPTRTSGTAGVPAVATIIACAVAGSIGPCSRSMISQ